MKALIQKMPGWSLIVLFFVGLLFGVRSYLAHLSAVGGGCVNKGTAAEVCMKAGEASSGEVWVFGVLAVVLFAVAAYKLVLSRSNA